MWDGLEILESSHDVREDAVQAARALALQTGAEVVIYDVGGKPIPPREPPSNT